MAPILGTVVGGPVGAGFGSIIANVFGTEDSPDAVMQALNSDPAAAVKLQQIQSEERVALQRIMAESAVQTVTQINETMRTEAKSEHWPQWSWRPFWGYISGLAFLVVCVLVCILAYHAVIDGKTEALVAIPQLISAFAALFAIPGGILGIASWHRGQAKRNH